MPATPEQVQEEKLRLYETTGVRDDIDDAEAELLLQWAETQIDRLAQEEGDFAQKNRFFRQLLARIDRLVGQRQYLDDLGHAEHITNLMKAMGISGYVHITEEEVLAALPADRADMRANLQALIALLTPTQSAAPVVAESVTSDVSSAPPADTPPSAPMNWLQALLGYRGEAPKDDSHTPDQPTGEPS